MRAPSTSSTARASRSWSSASGRHGCRRLDQAGQSGGNTVVEKRVDFSYNVAGQFTEIYMILPWKPLRTLVHAFNNFWFRAFGSFAGGSYGNILVFQRPL